MTTDASGVQARLIEVSPALAEKWLQKNTHNRKLVTARVAQYAADMRKGDWQFNGEAIKLAADGTILDGQHRLEAILDADVTLQLLVITGLPLQAQESMDQGRPRAFGDTLKLRGEKNYLNLAAVVRQLFLYERYGLPFKPAGAAQPTVHQLSRILERNPDVRDSLEKIASLRRSWLPVSLMATLHYLFCAVNEEDANDFFAKLASGENLTSGSPVYVLRERLIEEKYAADGGLTMKTVAAFVIRTWNAYQDGEQLARLVWNPGGAHAQAFPAIRGLAGAEQTEDSEPQELAA